MTPVNGYLLFQRFGIGVSSKDRGKEGGGRAPPFKFTARASKALILPVTVNRLPCFSDW